MLKIKKMTLQDLELVLGWAATEGWNPGVDDASAFLQSDPQGFLIGCIDDKPACAISVVRHDERHGFLGLYLCRPEFRGLGHGWTIWNAGIKCLGARTIGLDGVVQQQANYRKSGFTLSHRNIRFTGQVRHSDHKDECVDLNSSLQAEYVALDGCVNGVHRQNYIGNWCSPCDTRISIGYASNSRLVAAGTIRQCLEGHKIGPLIAPDRSTAEKIVKSLIVRANASQICLDVPESNPAALALARDLQLDAVFETARMYRGEPPSANPASIFGVATLELG